LPQCDGNGIPDALRDPSDPTDRSLTMSRPLSPLRGLLLALPLLVTAACSSTDDDALVDDTRPAAEIFAEAEQLFEDGDYVEAVTLYEDVERLHPYSPLAKPAMLRAAQANYEARNYEEARLAAERFLNFYPADRDAAQAQYIVALSHYDQMVDVGRDQSATREALAALRETMNRYPDSPYARSAQLKLDLAEDHLAGKEMEIGRYYLKRGHPVAAINRFRTVLERYQTTSHTAEALHRLVESYLMLGVDTEAQRAAAVLGHNFPGSTWYAASYDLLQGTDLAPPDKPQGFLSRTYRQVIRGEWL
jgi:outer membrane protein assembly factor BamD